MEKTIQVDNFVEVLTLEEANSIDLKDYVFIGLKDNAYCFKVRQRK